MEQGVIMNRCYGGREGWTVVIVLCNILLLLLAYMSQSISSLVSH